MVLSENSRNFEICLDENNIDRWKLLSKKLLLFLNLYEKLLDAYVHDFYAKQLWSPLNFCWKEALENFDHIELSNFLNRNSNLRGHKALPLSLLAFRATCFSFALPRNPINCADDINFHLKQPKIRSEVNLNEDAQNCHNNTLLANHLKLGESWEPAIKELSPTGGQHYLLEHIFRKHLKPKKQHEVVRMAQVASRLLHIARAEVVVDIGSGQGHLARIIGYGLGIPTICLEAEESFIDGARKFDLQLETFLKLRHNGTLLGPRHQKYHLHPELMNEDFSQMLKETWPELKIKRETETDEVPFILVGLHCCGDLGPTLLRLFTSVASCKALLLVGCCYMKLDLQRENGNYCGYPMSQHIKSESNNNLSYNAREMACHALEGYTNKLRKGADNLKVHCYRAVLEELIIRKNPNLRHSALRSVKNAHLLPFKGYAQKAISELGISLTEEELTNEEIEKKLAKWMEVVVFYSLRLMMAPAVESLILLDRLFYIYENKTAKSFVVPIFEPTLSPRNFALIAYKEK